MKPLTEKDRKVADSLVKNGFARVRKYKGEDSVVLTKAGRKMMKAMTDWFNEFWKIAPKEWKAMIEADKNE